MKGLYLRQTCESALKEAIKQAKIINQNKGKKKYLCRIDRMTVFGPLISSADDWVSGCFLNLSVSYIDGFNEYRSRAYTAKYGPKGKGWFFDIDFPIIDVLRTVKARHTSIKVCQDDSCSLLANEGGLYFDIFRDGEFQKKEYLMLKRHLAGIRATGDSYLKRHLNRGRYKKL